MVKNLCRRAIQQKAKIRGGAFISLIGSIYKILAKVLVNQLRLVLSYVITLEQGAFVDGRYILDSIFIAHKCINSGHCSKRPGLVCKLDFEQAYNID